MQPPAYALVRSLASLLLVALLLPASAAAGAHFFILNVNIGPVGFNDPTPVQPVGGNTGRTLGAQRLAVFERAAALWGQRLESEVTIVVQSQMNPLFCQGGAAILGTAAAFTAVRDFDGAPLRNTWYHAALARALAGEDLVPGYPDMFAVFSTSIDSGCIPGIQGWYYGLDAAPPPGTIELLPIVLHEIAHGLGFANLAREEDGSLFQGVPDIFTRFTFDRVAGQTWADMATDAERAASALRCSAVSWSGPRVQAEAADFLAAGAPVLTIEGPVTLAGALRVARARFGPPLEDPGISAPVVLANDGVGTTSDGCEGPVTSGTPWANAAAMAGAIALIDRGTCSFTDKVRNAQASGARAALIADSSPGCPPFDLTGKDPAVAIPSGRIPLEDGARLRAQPAGTVVVRLGIDASRLAGTDIASGQVLLFATDPLLPGSAISHFDTAPFPDLLMEPFANLAGREIDLTFAFLRDLGWPRMRSILEIPTLGWRGLALLAGALLLAGLALLRRSGSSVSC